MRLFLSSYLWGDHPEKLIELVGGGPKKCLVVTNASDIYPESGIVEHYEEAKRSIEGKGFEVERLDLKNYFDGSRREELIKLMKSCNFVWVTGGNTFVLRRAMKQSGFDEIILEMLNNDEIVYGGYSAGSCVMGSTLKGLEFVDDPNSVPEKYDPDVIWEGLNLVPYVFVPHYKSGHPETELVDKTVKYLDEKKIPYKTFRDGQAVIIEGDQEKFLK